MPKPTGDGAALLRAICDAPEEDTPRLAYADWLDEQGGESNVARAEFIRTQIAEEAKGVEHLNRRPLTPREIALYRTHYLDWKAELPEYPGLSLSGESPYGFGYDRGFVYQLYAKSVRSYLKAAPDLFARVPVTEVRFQTITPQTGAELAKSPALARVRTLDQLVGLPDEALREIGGSPHLRNLNRLIVSGREITMAGVGPLLANPAVTRLKEFRSSDCRTVGPGVAAALLASASAAVLEVLGLDNNRVTAAPGPRLAELLRLPKLRRLYLGSNGLGDEGVAWLAGVAPANALSMNLGFNGVTDRGGAALLAGPLLRSPGVRAGLHGNQFSDAVKAQLKAAFGDRVGV
ncbi:TIGR02996 domain-containing protein [Gemmata sp.]|uniref:TIGR02996 domain-containing protein n=1 Tax=Gemmata sp. TaxID=1914242 RepID=UPI003F6F8334